MENACAFGCVEEERGSEFKAAKRNFFSLYNFPHTVVVKGGYYSDIALLGSESSRARILQQHGGPNSKVKGRFSHFLSLSPVDVLRGGERDDVVCRINREIQ